MRDKKQRRSPREIGGHSLKTDKFTSDPKWQIAKDTTAAPVSTSEQLNMPMLDMPSDQNLNVTKPKSSKKSSNIGLKYGVTADGDSFSGIISEIEIVSPTKTVSKEKSKWSSSGEVKRNSVSKLVSKTTNENLSVDIDEEQSKKREESLFFKVSPKENRWLPASENDNDDADDISYVTAAAKYKANTSEINRHRSENGCVKITNTPGKEKSISDASSSTVIDSSALKTSNKNKNAIFPDLASSPEMPILKSSWLPFVASGFASHSRRKLINTSSPKSLDYPVKAEPFLDVSFEKSSNTSLTSDSSKKDLNNSSMSYRSANSPGSLSNETFSGNDSFLETPKTPESLNSTEIQKRSMSDVGPRHYQKASWRDNAHSSSRCLHASFLDTPPSARHQKRLLDDRHLFPKRYSNVPVERYQSFQRRFDRAAQRSDWKSYFINKCWSLRNNFIDSHCHLDFLFDRIMFDGSFQKYYRKNLDSFPSNFAGCVAVFCEPKSFTSEGLWKMLVSDDMVWLAMGCHPKKATGFTADAQKGLADCIKHPKVAAVGEIGLDYSGRFFESAAIQKKVFICQIKMALAIKKPLVIHCRDAQDDCLQILKQYVPSDYRIHCHCFTKSFEMAKEWLSAFPNLYIGLTPLVTYPSAKEVHDTARKIPLERLLLETDTPYFVPKCVPRSVKFSHPGMAISVAFEVAQLKGVDVETVLQHCLKNTKQMYGM